MELPYSHIRFVIHALRNFQKPRQSPSIIRECSCRRKPIHFSRVTRGRRGAFQEWNLHSTCETNEQQYQGASPLKPMSTSAETASICTDLLLGNVRKSLTSEAGAERNAPDFVGRTKKRNSLWQSE